MLNWIIKLIPTSAIKKYIGSIVRHALTLFAGVLAGMQFAGMKELADLVLKNMDSLESTLVTILMAVVALVMSFAEKKNKIDAK
jgi:uncharacterized membrane protein